ncbi:MULTISPECIES: helix-turn-helix domain-containing protein [unclassified Chitinophaga]|uniref:helix-turn-helix domain-containing protein n=1 Tax=unclassified Chitinophaga TaxID=2619133 RepID=UPI002CB9A5AB|nr:helix-turn-helix domain-containing protein [Chitinophaga sp.]HVI46128.1 helix-turn-helix domain-containing protein [Chitinophaga sp.]
MASIEQRLLCMESDIREIKSLMIELLETVSKKPRPAGGGEIMSVKELADFLRLDANTIYNKCAKGEMPHFRMGKLLKFKKSEILDWVKGLENGSDCSVDEYVNRYMQQRVFKS